METNFYITKDGLYHAGKGHDDNPPGRGSGRYAWGTGKDPKGKRKNYKGITGYFRKKAEDKRRREAYAAKKARQQDEARLAADKERVLKIGSAEEVLRYVNRGELTNEQMRIAINRIENTKRLKEIAEAEHIDGMKKIDKFMKNLDKVNDWTLIGITSYHRYSSVMNILDGAMKSSGGKSK